MDALYFSRRCTFVVGSITLAAAMMLAAGGCGEKKDTAPGSPGPPVARSGEFRGIWVTRFDYRSEADVVRIIRDCRSAGFTDVLFQVRGNGTAFYNSRLEPWAEELGGRDPGFDPLTVACRESHRAQMRLHAYVNVIPGWRGESPPIDRRQLYNAHPDWFWFDQFGRRQPLQSFYVSVNPCLPEVRRYLTAVCHDIVSRYDVDGLHLDYIRYPNEPPASPPAGADYPRDRRTVELFRNQTGTEPDRNPDAWNRWRADQLTALVREIRRMIDQTKPRVVLSAAVGPDPQHHLLAYHQDTLRWMREGLIDVAIPMNYTADDQEFADRNRLLLARRGRARVVPGMMIERPGLTAEQLITHTRRKVEISLGQAGGFCVFAYGSLFDRDQSPSATSEQSQLAQRRRLLVPFLRNLATKQRDGQLAERAR